MKQFIIGMLAVLCTGVFAWTWTPKDTATVDAEIKGLNSPLMQMQAEISKMYLADATQFNTWDKCKAAHLKVYNAKKNNSCTFELFIGQSVLLRSWFNTYLNNAMELCKNDPFVLNFYRSPAIKMTNVERWTAISNVLIDTNCFPGDIAKATDIMLKIDTRIPKAQKIEVYNMLYEKYLPYIADEQTVAAEKRIYTPFLGKIALKLKALGVNVAK